MAETTITGTVEDSKGGPLSGYAEFTATAVVADGAVLVPNVKVTVPVSAGVVEPTAIRSTEEDWRYTVTVYAQSGPKTVPVHTLRNVAISGASVALSQLVPALPAIPQSNADVLAANLTALEASLPSTYVATLGVSNGTDDTARINAVLAAASGKTVKGLPGQTYLISAPLVLPPGGNVVLDLTSCGVTLKAGSDCNMLRTAAATAQRTVANGAITIGTKTLTSATAAFTSADVGRTVSILGAGGGAAGVSPLTADITAVTNATTVTLSVAAHKTVSAATVNIHNRDANVSVIGGTWNRGANNGAGLNQHSLLFRHVDGLTVDLANYTSSNGKYAISVGSVTNYRLTLRAANASSDGIHITGPARGGDIPYATGTTVDDLVALTASDWSQYGDVAGDIIDLSVGTINAVNAHQAFKVIAGAGWMVDGVKVGNIRGTTTLNGVWLGDDPGQATTVGGSYGTIDLGTVSVVPAAGRNVINIGSPNADRITAKVRDVRATAEVSVFITGSSTATIKELEMVGCEWGGLLSQGVLATSSTVTISKMVFDRCRTAGTVNILAVAGSTVVDAVLSKCLGPYTGVSGWVFVNGGTLTDLTLRDCSGAFVGGKNGSIVYQTGGTVTRVKIVGGSYSGANGTFKNVAGRPAVAVTLDGCYLYDCTRVASFYGPATLILLSPTFDSINQAAFFSSTGPLVVKGGPLITVGGFTPLLRAGSESVQVVGQTLPFDLSMLAKNNGDMAHNTNAALACGAGPAVCNGTTWKNLHSGLTYP